MIDFSVTNLEYESVLNREYHSDWVLMICFSNKPPFSTREPNDVIQHYSRELTNSFELK